MQKITLLTIGQSPRHDMGAVIENALRGKALVSQAGVLDGLEHHQIKHRFKVQPGHSPLITRLGDGETCQLDPQAVEAGLQEKIDQLERSGADIIVVLCTGRFHTLHARRALLVEPDVVVPTSVAALVRRKTLGIMVPLPDQFDACAMKWQQSGISPVLAAGSPYADSKGMIDAARTLCESGADIIVLDCMGYTPAHKQHITRVLDVPVIVSAQAVAAVLTTLLQDGKMDV